MDQLIALVRAAKVDKGEDTECKDGGDGMFAPRQMTRSAVLRICRERGVFSLPSCNTILYLHQQKFSNISGLEAYTACKVLHLESNCITAVEGISHMVNLRVLYLQSNAIASIRGLESCTNLDTLNISSNPIKEIGRLPETLRTLSAARSGLSSPAVIRDVAEMCPNLQVVDLQHNALEGEEALGALQGMRNARVLYLQGNRLPNYRRRLITALQDLSYLDDRPVEDIERAGAEAWRTGGVEAERAARQAFRRAKRNEERRSTTSFALERAARQAVRESLATSGLPGGTASPDLQSRVVATLAAVEALPSETLPARPPAADCAVCSDSFRAGDTATRLPCEHLFHSSCIRPWLVSFSDSCPLCRQHIGGDTRETLASAAVHLAPLISEALARRLTRPASSPQRRKTAGRAGEARAAAEGAAPPRCVMGGAFTATDLVRQHAVLGRGAIDLAAPRGEQGAAQETMGACDPDPEQQRFRSKFNQMCRRNVGAKSREAASKLAAWNRMILSRSDTSTGAAAGEDDDGATEGSSEVEDADSGNSAAAASCREEAPGSRDDHSAGRSKQEGGQGVQSEDLRVERMLRFYAAINEQRPAEAQREERQGPEAKRAEAAPKPVGTLLLSDLAEEACPLKEVSRFPIGSGTASTADKQGENKAAVVQALPAGGPLTADGGDGLWDLSSEITVSAMPYM